MTGRRGAVLLTAAVLVGAAGGAGGYAAFGGDGGGGAAITPAAATTASTAAELPAPTPVAAATTSIESVYRRSYRGVVEITSSVASGSPVGGGSATAQGSGFVIDHAGHVVTNFHVVQGGSSLRVTFADGSKYDATVVGHDASTDLAVLKVDAPASELHPLALGNSAAVQVGQAVVAIGSPFGLNDTLTSGIVSAVNRTISSDTNYSIPSAIQTDAAINHGNSGGPLLDLAGHVVGVTSQIESEGGGNDGVGFAIPSNTVRTVATQLISGGTVRHAFLGVSVGDATDRAGARLGSVTAGGPAASAGLKAGDVVTDIAGATIASADDLTAAVAAHSPGDKVAVTFVRGGSTQTVTVTLGSHS